jgi:PAS domain S-box-containing protein
MRETSNTQWAAYGVAVLATAVSLLIRWPVSPLPPDVVPHMTFFPAVMVAAYFGGFRPGLLATLLSAVAANFFLTGQLRSFHVESVNDAAALALFVLTGVIISGLCESLHRAQRRILADERRRAEEALSQERYLLHALMDNLPDIIYFKDAGSRFLRINKALANYFGLSDPAQAIGKTDFDFFTKEHTGLAFADEQQIIRTGQPVVGKVEKRAWLDGRVRWLSTTKMPLRDKDATIVGTFGVSRDITEGKLAEVRLRESEQRWRNLTEALPQLVWSALPDGACDYFSTQWTEHTGAAEAELLGWRWLQTLHPEDREPTRQFWLESVAGRHPYDVEYRVRRRDGEYRWFKTRGVPIRDGSGNIVKWFGTCTDITDLRQTEEALRASEERFRGTFENAAVGIAHTHPTGRFLRVNEKFCAIVGYPREVLLQKTFQDITHPDDMAASLDPFTAVFRGESPGFELEKRYLRKDGSPVWVELFVSLQRDAAGQPAYAIAVLQDISERMRLVGELRQAKEAAEAANRAKDDFLANVSHEIRTPMNAILGMTELALDTPLTEDQRQCLKTVKSGADNLLSIINDLLDFSKIEAGKLELDPSDFSLRAALGDTLHALAVRAHAKGLGLICYVQPDVPDALVGDAGRLRQILLNLMGNAIKFTDNGEVVVTVKIADFRSKISDLKTENAPSADLQSAICNLQFSIRDTGIGIPQDSQERIFRAFEQEDASTTRKYGGTGLGLTIASRLVALMGGEITVDSEPGRGSTFAFTAGFGQPHAPVEVCSGDLAVTGDNAASDEPSCSLTLSPDPLVSSSSSRPLRILAAEDNEFNAQLLEQLLGRRGHRVRLAKNGREALALAERETFDLLLLDVHMPELNGFQVVEAIRERERTAGGHLPVIALTARARREDREQCLAAGMDDFLAKPIQADGLWAAIDRVVRIRGEESGVRRQQSGTGSTLTPDPSPLTPDSGLLDPAVLLAACGGDAAILEKISQAFRARLPDHLRAVQDAVRERDMPRLREAAHKLCGMVAAFSTVAGGVASELEDYAAQDQLEEAQPLVEQLEAMAQGLIQAVDGLSLETLRQQTGLAGDLNRAATS